MTKKRVTANYGYCATCYFRKYKDRLAYQDKPLKDVVLEIDGCIYDSGLVYGPVCGVG